MPCRSKFECVKLLDVDGVQTTMTICTGRDLYVSCYDAFSLLLIRENKLQQTVNIACIWERASHWAVPPHAMAYLCQIHRAELFC